MIRIGLPPPMLPRLRLHWHVARNTIEQYYSAFRAGTLRHIHATRALWAGATVAIVSRIGSLRTRRVPLEAQKQGRLERFEAVYEQLSDLICWAAKEEVTPEREAEYAHLRLSVRELYQPLRATLRPFWQTEDMESDYDPFEELFLPHDLNEVVDSMGGIMAISMAREAFEAYRESVR